MWEQAHAAATLMMTGIIWYAQVVHYPLFPLAKDEPRYFRLNMGRTGLLTIPIMLAELLCAVALCLAGRGAEAWAGLFLLGGIWALTLFQQLPSHLALGRGWDEPLFRRAVRRANWARVLLWTARAGLALSFMRPRDL